MAKIPQPEEMLERARNLIPVLRERAEACEAARRVPDETIADMQAAEIWTPPFTSLDYLICDSL